MNKEQLIENLNHHNMDVRLDSLAKLFKSEYFQLKFNPTKDVNNHIHTWYSFSPYSPAKAIWMAVNAGLCTAGIMDHDSVAGTQEFIEAGKIANFPVTIGAEIRVDMKTTKIAGRRINNPDQDDIVYMAIHGIPHTKIKQTESFFKPINENRNDRNIKMTHNLNYLVKGYISPLVYEEDVLPISKWKEGGSVTERHILFALAGKIIDMYGKGEDVIVFLTDKLGMKLSLKNIRYLQDKNNEYYQYDLLGALKSDLVEKFYIPAQKECPNVKEVIAFVEQIGAISAYAYLGDVGNSVTGDKRTQKFEDDFLDDLFVELKNLRFNAITYMPSRNTIEQLNRVKSLCMQYGMMEISGEDINSPRQSFVCEALREKRFHNLITSTHALIGHERIATEDINQSLFSLTTQKKYPDLNERIKVYADKHEI